MSNITFTYETVDNASPSIDRLNNKMKELTKAYGEAKRSVGTLKKGLNIAGGMGIGLGASMLSNMTKKEKPTGPKEKDVNGRPIVNPTQQVENKSLDTINQIGRTATFMAHGAIAGSLMNRFTDKASSKFKSSLSSIGTSAVGSVLGGATSSSKGNKGTFVPGMNIPGMSLDSMVDFGYVDPYLGRMNTNRVGKVGSKLRSSTIAGSRLGKGAGLVTAGRLAGLGGRLAMGAASLGTSLIVEAAYQTISISAEQFMSKKEWTPEYLDSLSGTYLASEQVNKDTWNEANNGDYGDQMWLIREIFGKNQDNKEELDRKIREQQEKRVGNIQKALWLQSRQ